ncbi:hypothetical protein Trydic_g21762 [Trypoxylus dichotomus]
MLTLAIIFTKFLALLSLIYQPEIAANAFELLLIHTNDLRGNLEGTHSEAHGTKVGGYPKIAHVINEARRNAEHHLGPPVLYLDAGDIYTENLWSNLFTRKILIEFSNLLHPDAAVLGCHNFHNVEIIEEFLQKIRFPIVASNVRFTKGIERYSSKIKPYLIIEISDVRIGIVGYITPKMHLFDDEGNETFVKLEDELESVNREVGNLKMNNVSFVIALGHSGYHTDRLIGQEVEGIDLIIGGLSHGLYWNSPEAPSDEEIKGPYPYVVQNSRNKTRKVLILHTYGFSKYLGKILLRFDSQNNLIDYTPDPLFLHGKFPEDPPTAKLVRIYKRAVNNVENLDQVLAQCIVPLDAKDIRTEESNLANVVTDALIYHMILRHQNYPNGFWTSTAISLINAGAIRKSIATSRANPNITRGMIKEMMPYRQHLVQLKLRGSDIIESLETGVRSNGETSRGEFLQFSGLRVFYDYDRPAGDRVAFVRVRCAECSQPTFGKLEMNDLYSVVLTAFIANGGDGHITIRSQGIRRKFLTDVYDVETLTGLLESIGKIRPEADERIQEFTNAQEKRYNRGYRFKTCCSSVLLLIAIWCEYVFI